MNADRWWITTAPLADGGEKVLGPFATQELALEVREYVEAVKAPQTFWVDQEPAPASPEAERLEAAERVCLLVGWTAARRGNDREKALLLLWGRWHRAWGWEMDGGPEEAPLGLGDEQIADLARQQDETDQLERMRYLKGTDDA